MSERSFGKWMYEKRIELKISQKQLCEGVCSLQTLSNIESDERTPDIFLWECLLQRLGISPDEFEVIVFDDEYEEIEKRDKVEAYVESGKMQAAKELTESKLPVSKKSTGLQKQYYYQLQALFEWERKNYEECLAYLKQAFESVHPKFSKKNKDFILFSIKDMELLCMMVEVYGIMGKGEEAEAIMDFLCKYIEENSMERPQLLKIYPKVAYLLAVNSYQEQTEVLRYCQKAFELLIEYDSTLFLAEIMEILIGCYKKMNLEKKVKRLEKQLKCLQDVYKEFGGNLYVSQSRLRWFQESKRKQYLLCSEMIKGERIARGIKREELIEGIYENPETLAKVESGKQNPSHKKFRMLMKRLDLPMGKYNSPLVTDEKEAFELREQIIYYMSRHEYENAKIEFEQLKLFLDCDNAINRQYVMKTDVLLDFDLKVISAEEFNKRELEVLKITYAGDANKLLRIPTLQETNIFNYIAMSYWEMGEIDKGIELHKKVLGCYGKSRVSDFYNDRCRSTIMRNYIMLLEVNGKCKKAIELVKDEIQSEFSVLRGGGIEFMCSELACIYEQMDMEDEKKRTMMEKYFGYAFYMSDLFLIKANNKAIDSYYRKKLNPDVEWYG